MSDFNAGVRAAAAELESNWGHMATPEMRDAILALLRTEPALSTTTENYGGSDSSCPAPEPSIGSREAAMIVLETNADGVPTVWCDPEIADLVRALNSGGVRTVASCSGHGTPPGIISLKDGRELLIMPDYAAARAAVDAVRNAPTCTAQTGPAAACVYREPLLRTAADQERD